MLIIIIIIKIIKNIWYSIWPKHTSGNEPQFISRNIPVPIVTLAVYFEKEPVPYSDADWSASYIIKILWVLLIIYNWTVKYLYREVNSPSMQW